MEKKLAMKWVKALRSGKFKQTKGELRVDEESDAAYNGKTPGYCCLGVLATICNVDEDIIQNHSTLNDPAFKVCKMSNDEGIPKDETRVKVRVGRASLDFRSLAHANDNGASFRAIATWIEKNYKKL